MKSASRVHLRSLWPTVAVAGLALALVACGAAASATATAPIRLHTPYGVVTIAKRPERIVSLSATATEDLYAVGAGRQVVAVDSYSNYPPQAPRTHLSGFTPNIEAIAKYRPDLVLIDTDANHIVRELGKLGIPVLVEPPAANLTGVYAEITQIAKATGQAHAAARVNAKIRRQVAAIVHSVPRPTTRLTVYHELDQHFYSATSHTFIGQMYKLLGLVNIADKAKGSGTYPQLSARPGWGGIAAVKSGEVVPVNDSIASEWGPRIVLFLKAVAGAVKTLEGHTK
jgi:iron complex transport system substrate-binding protein